MPDITPPPEPETPVIGTLQPETPAEPPEPPAGDGRPGGPSPAARIEQLETQVAALLAEKAEAVTAKRDNRSKADQAAADVAELRAEIEATKLGALASSAGALNPDTVTKLLSGAADPAAALAALKESDPYLFGTPKPAVPSSDPENGSKPAKTGDEIGDHLRQILST